MSNKSPKQTNPASASVSEAARWIGCARQTLAEWLKEAEIDYSRGVDVPAFLKWKFRRERDEGREEVRKKYAHVEETIEEAEAAGWISADEAKRRKLVADAAIRELDLDEKNGALVRTAEVAGVVQDEYAVVREAVLTLPGRAAERVRGQDEDGARAILEEEVDKILGELRADARYERERKQAESLEEPKPGAE